MKKVMAQKNVTLNEKNITALKLFCQTKHSTILDFQKLFNGTLVIIKIDENGIILNKLEDEKTVSAIEVNHLIDAINSNNLQQFAVLANSIYRKLDLGSIKTKNIIICPDEFLEKLPFDALAQISDKPKLWSDLEYIGKTKNIQLIPNIQSLVQTAEIEAKLEVDIWSSELANATLPYNELLIRYLEEDLSANTNQTNPMNVLHILAHTNRTAENNIEFLLDNDTITIDNNGCKSPILTILEGCSSGDGKIIKSEGTLSLTRSFLYKNTPTVIYSIWDADNHSSSVLFKHFYAYLLKGVKTSEALYRSKNDLINDHLHPEWASPYYWANYQITGNNILFTH
jgi:CHAT domain-containing protein